MYLNEQEINAIISQSTTFSEFLRHYYLENKKRQNKVSFAFLCKKLGIPSKGYLAYVMKGQRQLNSKYWPGLGDALRLTPAQYSLLEEKYATHTFHQASP